MTDRTLLLSHLDPQLVLHGSERSHEQLALFIEEGGRARIEVVAYRKEFNKDEYTFRVLRFNLASARDGACHVEMDDLREDLADGGYLSEQIDILTNGHTIHWMHGESRGCLTTEASEAQTIIAGHDYTGEPAPTADRRRHAHVYAEELACA